MIVRRRVVWTAARRVVAFRARPAMIFEQVATPEELAAVLALRDAFGAAPLDAEDIVAIPGLGWILPLFLRPSLPGGRFHDGTFGACYVARELATAIAESQFHFARFLAGQPMQLFGVRVLHVAVRATLVDLRGRAASDAHLYDPDPARYAAAQAFAREQRAAGALGIVYDSVRRAGGQCAALLRPRAVRRCAAGELLAYEWDGTAFRHSYRLAELP